MNTFSKGRSLVGHLPRPKRRLPLLAHRDISRRRNERRAHLLRLWHSRQSRLESDAQQRMAAIREILPGAGEQGKSLRELKTAERALKAEKPAKAGRAKRKKYLPAISRVRG